MKAIGCSFEGIEIARKGIVVNKNELREVMFNYY